MNWNEEDHRMKKTFRFSTFEEALEWMSAVAGTISKMDHHPTWTNTYNKVEVFLTTHSAGNTITAKDRELAAAMDTAYLTYAV